MSTRNSINSIKGSALQDRRSAVEPAGIGSKSAAAVVSATRPVVVSATRPVVVSATRPAVVTAARPAAVVTAARPAAVVTGHIPVEDQRVETRLIALIITVGAEDPQAARSE